MSKRRRKYNKREDTETVTTPAAKNSVGFLVSKEAYETLCVSGYTRLDQIPEIVTGCYKKASLLASMTIHLMSNKDNGDIRIQNELSRMIDINPNKYMTRVNFMTIVIMNMLLYGKGNSIVRVNTKKGLLDSMDPIPPNRVTLVPDASGYAYTVNIDGVARDPDDILHFVYNPDPYQPWRGRGMQVVLKDVAGNLRQAAATEKGFMESKWKPSVIVKVDGLTEEFASPEGRKKLLESYIDTAEAGEPWLIPADQFSVEQIRPLSLADLAIKDTVELDKRTVAAILGVPPFVLGIGQFNRAEWNNFVNTELRTLAKTIEQEMTRKLILSPNWYLRFNVLSLLDYDMETIAKVFCMLQDRGDVSGNEVRDRLGMSPVDGLDDRKVLENYIPVEMSGKQKKLIQDSEGE